jgi:hypothetical protein
MRKMTIKNLVLCTCFAYISAAAVTVVVVGLSIVLCWCWNNSAHKSRKLWAEISICNFSPLPHPISHIFKKIIFHLILNGTPQRKLFAQNISPFLMTMMLREMNFFRNFISLKLNFFNNIYHVLFYFDDRDNKMTS